MTPPFGSGLVLTWAGFSHADVQRLLDGGAVASKLAGQPTAGFEGVSNFRP